MFQLPESFVSNGCVTLARNATSGNVLICKYIGDAYGYAICREEVVKEGYRYYDFSQFIPKQNEQSYAAALMHLSQTQ